VKLREPPQRPFKMPTKAVGWLLLIGTIVLSFSLPGFVGEDRGTIMAIAIGALAMLVQFSWPLRKERWFWVLIAMFAVLDVAGVFWLDWSWLVENRPNGKALGELGFIDFLAMSGITYGTYRLKFGKPTQSVEPSIDDLPSYADRIFERPKVVS
jgi:hypothetical protein